ncbi:MAG: DUF305 domain-containing protein [Sodalinema sp.]|uniref:DUF305 domain-containing protein n=1 Tax=Sodalinema sp. TaxID=3080550 RepID=UPI0012164B16|nr:MAG: DUF305 domain-containing protein [Phormidium sp. SL48-SHIP]
MIYFHRFTQIGLGLTATLVLGLGSCRPPETADSSTSESPPRAEDSMNSPMSPDDPMAPQPGSGMDRPGMNGQGMPMNGMYLGPNDEQFELRFLDAMILHHQGAVEMAEDSLEKSQREDIRQLSQEIIETQRDDIAQMQAWRSQWYADAPEAPQMYDAQMSQTVEMNDGMMSMLKMEMDLGAADEDYDQRYMNAMIAHHEGALDMARQVLENSDRPEVEAFANDLIETQMAEVQEMLALQESGYGDQ